MEEAKLESIRLRMALAEEKLVVARDLLAAGHYNDVIAKAYYAMFYASKALLLAVGEDPVKHTGVVTLFGKRFVKVGLINPKYGRTLAIAKRLRERSVITTSGRGQLRGRQNCPLLMPRISCAKRGGFWRSFR